MSDPLLCVDVFAPAWLCLGDWCILQQWVCLRDCSRPLAVCTAFLSVVPLTPNDPRQTDSASVLFFPLITPQNGQCQIQVLRLPVPMASVTEGVTCDVVRIYGLLANAVNIYSFFLQGVPMCSVAWLHVSLQYCGAEDNHLGLLRWGTSFSPTEGCTPAIHTQKLLKGFW